MSRARRSLAFVRRRRGLCVLFVSPSSRHAARVSALVAIALCAFAPIAVSRRGRAPGSDASRRRGDALRSWIDANGENGVELEGVYLGEHDGVAAAYRAGGAARRDVGVFAASGGLDAGEAYVSVPWSLVLSAETVGARRPALGALLTQLRAEYGADEKSALMLALLHERFASPEDSPWRDYLAALPAPGDDDGFDATVRWSPASLRELRGSWCWMTPSRTRRGCAPCTKGSRRVLRRTAA